MIVVVTTVVKRNCAWTCATAILGNGGSMGVPPVNSHGQDGRATADDFAPQPRLRLTVVLRWVKKEFIAAGRWVITSRFRAYVAMVLIGCVAAHNLYSALTTTPFSRMLTTVGNHPHWPFVAALVALDVCFAWLFLGLALTPMRKEEKAMWMALAGCQLLCPALLIFPRNIRFLELVLDGFLLTAFLAAVALFASFSDEQEHKDSL